jgi:broad specificity phosphatase PhoE
MPALYLIRHGEPEIRGVLSGQTDPVLSSAGHRQAANLRIHVLAVYSSPLRRARETALYLHPSPIILPELAEISYGLWDGLSWGQIEQKWPEIAKAKLSDWQGVNAPGGEAWESFQNRVNRALEIVRQGPLPAAVVAHEAVNAIIGRCLNDIPINNYKQEYCEIKLYNV